MPGRPIIVAGLCAEQAVASPRIKIERHSRAFERDCGGLCMDASGYFESSSPQQTGYPRLNSVIPQMGAAF